MGLNALLPEQVGEPVPRGGLDHRAVWARKNKEVLGYCSTLGAKAALLDQLTARVERANDQIILVQIDTGMQHGIILQAQG